LMSQEDETPKPDWAELARQAQYVREQNFETLRRLIEAGRVAEAHLGPTLAADQELMRAMDAGIREVMEAVRGFGGQPPLPTGAALLTGTAALGGKGTLTAAGGLSLSRLVSSVYRKPGGLARPGPESWICGAVSRWARRCRPSLWMAPIMVECSEAAAWLARGSLGRASRGE
jgi:hypothetical protein